MVEAALLAAGEGRRLKPITNYYPKPLLPIVSVPLLQHILLSLEEQGIGKVCINVCHLKSRIIDFLRESTPRIRLVLSEEEKILGTGGGIGAMRGSIQTRDFVVHNGDIVTDIRFAPCLAFHRAQNAMATLIVEKRAGTQDVLLDDRGRIVDIAGRLGRDGIPFGYTGIGVLSRGIFDHLPERGYADLVDTYASMIEKGKPLYGFESKGHYWLDIGTKEKYLRVHRDILVDKQTPFRGIQRIGSGVFIGTDSWVSEKARLSGFISIGANCSVEAGVHLENCVVLDNTHVQEEDFLTNAVIAPEFIA